MADQHPTYLEPSELGTKDYWETYYARTLSHLSTKQPAPAVASSSSTNKPTQTQTQTQALSSSDEETDDDDEVDDDSDPGTSWFSEHNAPEKVLDFLTDEAFPLAPCNTLPGRGQQQLPPHQPSILDLGTGNGSMLALLRKRGGFRGELVGVDYSAQSVELARRLQALRIHRAYLSDSDDSGDEDEGEGEAHGTGAKGEGPEIRFEEWDILSASEGEASVVADGLGWFPYEQRGFDIVLDKGTFDAVSLSAEVGQGEGEERKRGKMVQRRVCERYPGIARGLVRPGGFLVVTSCNWTEEELVEWFTASASDAAAAISEGGDGGDGGEGDGRKDRLVVWGRVEYPRFRFGGREGQGVCTVCFQRVVS
ncbi:putative S-adenosylmethionine-dependent methyltransferase [Aspergillus brunneoviolaceus CBS 621.78]|uniref:Uncharacterized protein n=1 Tax=Aspergillus brunneoviolaceus CBS 621.78 TaxID=1450534 RepID=A0ACD1FWY0_9EURO|nr:hypothetical protein BO95DRAFT_373133 [Aspergillus brunneoviolaceus CBS 621.78]RAH41462.1 hypothetical protein BO95DRAFT_373133 [Aspergillus brunneoviolaceus CBS 621.78]